MKLNVTIFDYLTDILVNKKGNLDLSEYVPYMINRWLSFLNPIVAQQINIFNNTFLLENKELHYKTMLTFFPKINKLPRFEYIKKLKETKEETDKTENILAQKLELSVNEIKNLKSTLNELL